MKPRAQADGTMDVRLLDERTIETVGIGYVSAAVLARTRASLKETVGPRRIRYWVANSTGVTGFSADVGEQGSGLLADFRALGGAEIVATLPNPAVRMIVVAVAFAAGVPLKVFAEHAETLRYHEGRPSS